MKIEKNENIKNKTNMNLKNNKIMKNKININRKKSKTSTGLACEQAVLG